MAGFLSSDLIVFVRHAETVANTDGILVGRGHAPFTERGAAQVEALVEHLVGLKVDRVFSSPSERTSVVARAVADAMGVPCALDERLHEIDFGPAEGLRYADLPRGGVWMEPGDYARPIVEGGESRTQVDERVASFLADIMPLQGTSLVVSHGGPLRSALATSLGLDPVDCWAFHIDNGAVITVSVHDGSTAVLEELRVIG